MALDARGQLAGSLPKLAAAVLLGILVLGAHGPPLPGQRFKAVCITGPSAWNMGSDPSKDSGKRRRQKGKGRRDELSIIEDMLTISKSWVNKTRILYGANLSHYQMMKYLKLLTERDLVESDNGRYHTTMKGRELLELLDGETNRSDDMSIKRDTL